jgi:hypothetical protein
MKIEMHVQTEINKTLPTTFPTVQRVVFVMTWLLGIFLSNQITASSMTNPM